MIQLLIHNSTTVVISEDEVALTLIEDTCTLVYEYFWRRKGSPRAKRDSRDLRYFDRNYGDFPAGWTGKVCRALKRHDIPFSVVDERKKPKKISLPILALPDEVDSVYDHQNEAVVAVQEAERGIVRVPTRGGKTLIMALTIASFSVPTVVMVPNVTLLHQEYEVFSQVFGEDRVGRLGDGHADYDRDVIVATVPTLSSRADDFFTILRVFRRMGCLLLDECHHVSHGGYKLRNTYFEVAQRCEAAYFRVGFTATPGKTTSLERQLLTGVAGKLIYSIDIEELTKRDLLTPAQVKMVVVDRPHTPTLREILEEQHGITVPARADLEQVFRKHQLPVPKTPTFHEQLREKVVDDHDFRLLVRDLAEHYSNAGRSVIVLVSLVEKGVRVFTEGEYAIKDAVGLSGEDADRNIVLENFRHGTFQVLVSTLVREGVDIPKADVLIMAQPDVQDATPVLQRAGRVLTRSTGKDSAVIVDFYLRDQGVLERHSKARMKLYDQNSFNIDLLGAEDVEKMRNAI